MSQNAYKSIVDYINVILRRSHRNKLQIFVEDKNLNGFYQRLFHKIYPNRIIVIYSTHDINNSIQDYDKYGKDALIDFYEEIEKSSFKKEDLFIKIFVDPDFQLLLNKPELILNDDILKYWERYCIENYLIDNKLMINTIQRYNLNETYEKLNNFLNFDSWITQIEDDVSELFSYFSFNYNSVEEKKDCIIQRREFSMNDRKKYLLPNPEFQLDRDIITKYFDLLKANYIKKFGNNFDTEFHRYYKEFQPKIRSNIVKYVCGKFLFESIFRFIKENEFINGIPSDLTVFKQNLLIQLTDLDIEKNFGYLIE
jgi:hypothetical protein